jgi:hypothetical protein
MQGRNGFQIFNPGGQGTRWEALGDGRWQGNVILGTFAGVTKTGSMDVCRLLLDAVKLGDATLGITEAKVYGIDVSGSGAASNERAVSINPPSATTKVFSVYDINGDGRVDGADLSLAFYHYQAKEGDAGWENAKAADVNGDGVVNMLDLLGIYANYIG